jgi:hypothetical protein
MAVLPALLAVLGTVEAAMSSVVFIEFIKEDSIQSVMMAASQAAKYNQRTMAKDLYAKLRDYYIKDLAMTVGKIEMFDSDLTHWANWTPWGVWDTNLNYGPLTPYIYPVSIALGLVDNNGWGSIAPYAQQAFVDYVNASLLSCKTNLDLL